MSARLRIMLVALALAALLGGCWSRTEVEDLAIITAYGIDKVNTNGEEKWRVTAQVVRPLGMAGTGGQQGGGGGGELKPVWLVSGIGDTLSAATRNLSTRSPRRIFLAHANLLVIGERAAREGVGDIKDVLLRDPRFRLRMWVLVSRCEALDALRAEPELENLLSEELRELIQETLPRAGKAHAEDLNHFINRISNPGRDAVVSRLIIFKPLEEAPSGDGAQGSNGGGGGEGKQALRLNGAAVFKGDRLAGWMEDRETRGYLFAANQEHYSVITFWHRGSAVSFTTTRLNTRITPLVEDGSISFTVDIQVEGDINEHTAPGAPDHPAELEDIAGDVEREITAEVYETIRLARQYGADILGLGQKLHREYPRVWKEVQADWDTIYPTVDVTVTVRADVRRIGLISESPAVK